MESPQSVVSPLKTSLYSEPKAQNLDLFTKTPNLESKKPENFLGVLEVYIHQARDIQNICIYQKQDVYAKVCLTNNPEKSVTTQTVNGGGKNPVFNETLKIDVSTFDSSLKCEIYMLSRVKNYLEDQLLGFALIPLSEIVIENGKLEKEFTLSSTDLFHSPAGFVQLSLSYNGSSPDVIHIPPPIQPVSELPKSDPCELEKIEFPDPKIANENDMMVSEYFGVTSESLVSSDADEQATSDLGATFVESFAKNEVVVETPNLDSAVPVVSTESCDTPQDSNSNSNSKSANQEYDSPLKAKATENGDSESEASGEVSINGSSIKKLASSANFEPEQKVVQQDFVDLYMKSMQQFTESLAKMKLPLETSPGNSSSDQDTQTPNSGRTRVFYGSRAFF